MPDDIGITDEDRRRLAAWAEGRPPTVGNQPGDPPPDHEPGLPAPSHPMVEDVREALAGMDADHVRAAEVAEAVPYSAHQVGKALSRLAEAGVVELWGSEQKRVYRVL